LTVKLKDSKIFSNTYRQKADGALQNEEVEMTINNSILTNAPKFQALKNLNAINDKAADFRDRVASGLRVGGALDEASNFSIAQGLRTELKAIATLNKGLDQALGLVKVALAGTEANSDV
jgi:flagellin